MRVCNTKSQCVPLRLGGNFSAQNRSNSSFSYSTVASQQAPHCRGRFNCRSFRRMRTISSLLSATARSSGNSATVLGCSPPSSKISIVRRQASCWVELISPKYNTCRWTTFPPATRLFSTMENDSCSLPFFLRRIERKNMAPDYAKTSPAEKRVGRHYRPFPPFLKVGSLEHE